MIRIATFRSARSLRIALLLALAAGGVSAASDRAIAQPRDGGGDDAHQTARLAGSPQLRVATIGYRLATRGLGLCPRSAAVTGLLLHDLASYDAKVRPAIAERFALQDGFGVLGVVPGSPADLADLVPGDEIIGLNGAPLEALLLPTITPSASYARVEAFLDRLNTALGAGPATLTVRNDGRTRDATLARREGCVAQVTVVPGTRPDAWSDDRYAAVTEGLAAVAGDDELAFALGHEMAHVILGHAGEPHGPLTGIGIGGKRSRDRERAADELGITMSVMAGYDPAGAEQFLERLARLNGPSFSLTHPSVRSRIDAIARAAAHIRSPDPAR